MRHAVLVAMSCVFAVVVVAEAAHAESRPGDPAAAWERLLEDRVFTRLVEADALGDIDVSATRDVVTLSGTVPSEHARRRAVRIAGAVPGVRAVNDRVEVRPAAARESEPRIADAVLAQRVAEEIVGAIPRAKAGEDWWGNGWRVEGQDNGWRFTVEADDGVVSFDGSVRRYDVLRKAVEAARTVDGVRRVRVDLEIEPFYSLDPYFYAYRYGYPYGEPQFAYGPYWVP